MIHTENLTRIFERKNEAPLTAVNDLSIDVRKGEVFGFLGPNGAGKFDRCPHCGKWGASGWKNPGLINSLAAFADG